MRQIAPSRVSGGTGSIALAPIWLLWRIAKSEKREASSVTEPRRPIPRNMQFLFASLQHLRYAHAAVEHRWRCLMLKKLTFLLMFCVGCAIWVPAQNDNAMAYGTPSKSKFVNMPNLPDCMKVAVERGDPSKGASVLLLKFEPGCTIPWHWHTAGETLIIVKGTGKMQMKDGQPMDAGVGDFVYLPGKNVHTFRSSSAVLLYDLPDGAFDIHVFLRSLII